MRNTLRIDPNTYGLTARLDPVGDRRSTGRVEYTMDAERCTYRLEAEVIIPFEDFTTLGIDPQGGFDDEDVQLTIPHVALALDLDPARIEASGIVFTVTDEGTGLFLHRGDRVTIEVHARQVASGVF